MDAAREIEKLIGRVSLRDRAAFKALYDATSPKLFGICLRVLKDRAEAEDALQEVYVRVWQNADRYAANGLSPMMWLITIARNRSIDRLRARRGATGDIDLATSLPDRAPTPEGVAVARSEAKRVLDCLAQLPSDRASAVKGAYLDGATYEELARRFEVPLNTMRTWLRRSLQSLKECLSR
jgi:RNA polymerase sigma-70 factor, ECF subfamily